MSFDEHFVASPVQLANVPARHVLQSPLALLIWPGAQESTVPKEMQIRRQMDPADDFMMWYCFVQKTFDDGVRVED